MGGLGVGRGEVVTGARVVGADPVGRGVTGADVDGLFVVGAGDDSGCDVVAAAVLVGLVPT